MKNMRRLLALMLALVLLLQVGCGKTPAETPAEEAAKVTSVKDPATPPTIELHFNDTAMETTVAPKLFGDALQAALEAAEENTEPFPNKLTLTVDWGETVPEKREEVKLATYVLQDGKPQKKHFSHVYNEDGSFTATLGGDGDVYLLPKGENQSILTVGFDNTESTKDEYGVATIGFVITRPDGDTRYITAFRAVVDPDMRREKLEEDRLKDPPLEWEDTSVYFFQYPCDYYCRYRTQLQKMEWVLSYAVSAGAPAMDDVLDEVESRHEKIETAPEGEYVFADSWTEAYFSVIFDGTLKKADYQDAEAVYMRDKKARVLTDEDIEVLFSGDRLAIDRYFASPYSLVTEKRVYSGYWLCTHTAEEYLAEKLPLADLEKLLTFYQSEEATEIGPTRLAAFEERVKAYRALCNK